MDELALDLLKYARHDDGKIDTLFETINGILADGLTIEHVKAYIDMTYQN